MKKVSQRFAAVAGVSALALGSFAPMAQAQADVSASVGIANMYYWRGLDLGDDGATPAVSADLNVSTGGAYAGVWTSSGDHGAGTEYDLYAGYGTSVGDFTVDASLWSYQYPETGGEIGDLMEVVLSAGWGPLAVTYIDNIEGMDGYWYTSVGATFDAFSVTYGLHEDDYAHVDLGYAYNDNLSFILGVPVDDAEGAYSDQMKVVASYSVPIDL